MKGEPRGRRYFKAGNAPITAKGKIGRPPNQPLADEPDAAFTDDDIRRILRGADGFQPTDLIPSAIPYLPSPALEAKQLIDMIGRGADSTADDLRRLIQVTPRQAAFLRKVTAGNPLKARSVEKMLTFREQVLAAFNAQLANPALGAELAADHE